MTGAPSQDVQGVRALNRRLIAENRALRDQIEILQVANGAAEYPKFVRVGFTELEARFLAALVRRGEMTIDQLMTALYADRNGDEPAPQILHVLASRIRKKLKPHGVVVSSRRRVPAYWLDDAGRAKASALIGEPAP